VGVDPWTIRFINAYKDGDIKPHRKVAEDATLIEVMQAAAQMAGHDLPQEFKQMTSQMEGAHG
jgi:CO/xanthine dehydrogenase Mo-binding subunit